MILYIRWRSYHPTGGHADDERGDHERGELKRGVAEIKRLISAAPWYAQTTRLIARDGERLIELSGVQNAKPLTDRAELSAARHLRSGDVAWLIKGEGGWSALLLSPYLHWRDDELYIYHKLEKRRNRGELRSGRFNYIPIRGESGESVRLNYNRDTRQLEPRAE